jgi:uncharacterized protein YecT (DUF1311 family)
MSRVWKLSVALLLVLPAFAPAKEEKPKPLEEAKAAFAKADKALNEAWTAAKKALAEPDFAELQVKQRDWMKYREDQAHAANRDAGEPETKLTASYYEAATEITASRAAWLRGRIRNDEESLTGLWNDSFGGTLEIVQEKERLLFEISVVRGPTYHTGSLAGVATWNSPLGWFSDKGRDIEKTEESNLVFVERGTVLEIISANTSFYHGARAYFDGQYCKVDKLDEKRQADVTKAAESGAIPEEN